MLKLETV